ncbi:hypothetical protein I6F26_10200 [Ensifer sp. IC3342]|nr:hypothetical protein [Ensifer sp. BRP08]MCA1446950.1 hypothetical protein [Ensifer sp. IC3342]
MNGEKVSGIVATVTESMKDNPSCLAAILFAAMFAALVYFGGQANQQRQYEAFDKLMTACFADTSTGPVPRREP